MTPLPFYQIALPLARYGFHVFPLHRAVNGACSCRFGRACKSPAKHPIITGWYEEATTDPEKLSGWGRLYKYANVGVSCKASRLIVLDVDPRHGGEDSLHALVKRFAPLPTTPTVLTGGGGTQQYFAASEDDIPNEVGLTGFPGLDLRTPSGTSGGLVVGVGSTHASGRRYAWEVSAHSDDTPLAPFPVWLAALARESEREKKAPAAIEANIKEGKRNDVLFSLAGTMRKRGMSERAICAALTVTNAESCAPPLTSEEVARIAASIARYTPGDVSEAFVKRPKVKSAKPPVGSVMEARTVTAEEARNWLH